MRQQTNAFAAEKTLGRRLIHEGARCRQSHAGIGDVRKLEQPLETAVFTEYSMQREERNVELKGFRLRKQPGIPSRQQPPQAIHIWTNVQGYAAKAIIDRSSRKV